MSLLTLVQSAALRLGLVPPDTVIDNPDETATRLRALANQSGMELMRRHDWTRLTKEQTFTTVAQEIQTSAIPADFDRFVNGTIFNRTSKRKLNGPLTAEEWQTQKSLTISILLDAFRVRGSDFIMLPTPTADETVAYEYISKYWVDADDDGTGDATSLAADAAVTLLDEETIVADCIWRYQQSAGLGYAESFRNAQVMIADRIARDGGRRTMDLGYTRSVSRPRLPSMPEGDWVGS